MNGKFSANHVISEKCCGYNITKNANNINLKCAEEGRNHPRRTYKALFIFLVNNASTVTFWTSNPLLSDVIYSYNFRCLPPPGFSDFCLHWSYACLLMDQI